MASRRMIDPSIWQSETMASLTMRQRLLFIGLFSNADDQGRLRAHPALVRSLVFPYDDVSLEDIADDLAQLTRVECVFLYDANEKRCLQIVNWWSYQSPQWAYPSKIPAPEGWQDKLRYRQDNQVITDNWRNGVLPKALGKTLPKEVGKALDCTDSIRVSTSTSISSTNGEAPPPDGDSSHSPENEPPGEKPPIPVSLQEWIGCLDTYNNHPALVHRMCEVLFPNKDPPDYGLIGKTAKVAGTGKNGYVRLMGEICLLQARPPAGDILPYILAKLKGNNNATYSRDNDQLTTPGSDDAETIARKLAEAIEARS
jgi:hypothetical protein